MRRNSLLARWLLTVLLLAGLLFGAVGDVRGEKNSAADSTATPTATPTFTFPHGDLNGDAILAAPGDVDLSLDMTVPASDNFPNVGETVTFTIKVKNNDALLNATGVTVRDVLPVGLDYKSDDSVGTYNEVTGIWVAGSIAPGATAQLKITATVTQTGSIVNEAEVWTADQGDPDSIPQDSAGDDYDTVTINPKIADLSLLANVSDTTPNKNDIVQITITVTNAGPDTAENVTVKDLLPAGLTYVNDSDGGTTYNATTGIWAVGTLLGSGAGASDSITITAQVTTVDVKTNVAEVWTSDQYDADSTPGNETPGEDDHSSQVITPQSADLEVTKAISNPKPGTGNTVSFTLTIENKGPNNATNVAVKDLLSADFTHQSHSGGAYNPGTGIWTIGNLANGASASLTIIADVNANGVTSNCAEVSASDQFDIDSEPNNNSTTEDDEGCAPLVDLRITKSANPTSVIVGSNVVFTVTVINDGPGNAANVVVKDLLPTEFTYISHSGVGSYDENTGMWDVGMVSTSAVLSITAQANSNGTISNSAEVWSMKVGQVDPDSTPGNSLTSEDDYANAVVSIGIPLRTVTITEVGWMGTQASSSDEWMELHNNSGSSIDLTGWSLKATDGTPNIALSGTIPANGYFLLERTDDNTISNIPADFIYTGEMGNSGEALSLYDPLNNLVDTANSNGDDWPAGSASTFGSMERSGTNVADSDFHWLTHTGDNPKNGLDANNNPIWGTPRNSNWSFTVTATFTPTITLTPSHTPTSTDTPAKTITISEVAWMGTQASSTDEWIELYNHTNKAINLTNWRLRAADGSPDFVIENCQSSNPNCIINPGGYFLLERTDDTVVSDIPADMIYGGELSNLGEALSLYDPLNNLVDTANGNGGEWPGGSSSTLGSMERRQPTATDLDSAWFTHSGGNPRNGKDAAGNDIKGTPKKSNWSFTVTATATPTSTPTQTGTLPPTQVPFKTVVISEVAWAGTNSSSYDEWIELYNTTSRPIDLEGWRLVSFRWDGTKFVINLNIALTGTIPPRTSQQQNDMSGYYLLETRESAISNLTADKLYSGTLYNTGEILLLCSKYNVDIAQNCTLNTKNQLVDYVNGSLTSDGKSRPWPAGSSSTYGSMERRDVRSDEPTTYFTHTGASPQFGKDANGNNIKGTPKHANWAFTVTATPYATYTPTRTPTPRPQAAPIVVINEVLVRAGTDWNLDGAVDVYDEFIEVMNAGTVDVNIGQYKLDDKANGGSAMFTLPSQTLKPGEKALFYASQSGIRLEDAGDTVRLIRASNSSVVDEVTYPVVRSVDASICRYTDGYGSWIFGCFPTPGRANSLSGEAPTSSAAVCYMPDSAPLEFVLAECEEFGYGIWNPSYWDSFPGEGGEVWKSDPNDKWVYYYE